MGPSHDQEIIEELFTNVIHAAEILNKKDLFISQLISAKENLLKPAIGSDGRIQEWAKPYIENEPGHRHLSHLYALYPGNAFNSVQTPTYWEAAKKSLVYRLKNGGGYTGWSAAWVTNLWARLKDGEQALHAFNEILMKKSAENLFDLQPNPRFELAFRFYFETIICFLFLLVSFFKYFLRNIKLYQR